MAKRLQEPARRTVKLKSTLPLILGALVIGSALTVVVLHIMIGQRVTEASHDFRDPTSFRELSARSPEQLQGSTWPL
jgi:hypothetical protein